MTHLRAFAGAGQFGQKSSLYRQYSPDTWNRRPVYHNDSTGEGDHGEIDSDGPWKTADGITVLESPALKEFQVLSATPKAAKTTSDQPRRKGKGAAMIEHDDARDIRVVPLSSPHENHAQTRVPDRRWRDSGRATFRLAAPSCSALGGVRLLRYFMLRNRQQELSRVSLKAPTFIDFRCYSARGLGSRGLRFVVVSGSRVDSLVNAHARIAARLLFQSRVDY